MSRFLIATLGTLLLAAGISARAAVLDELVFEPVAAGLTQPTNITQAGDGSGRLFINRQGGRIMIYQNGQVLPTPFLDIRARVGCCGERGLLGLAFHPDYENNGRFFVNYTNNENDTVISEFRVSGNPNLALPDSEIILMTIGQPFRNHNGGQLAFGPDGFLYIATGDGGAGGDPGNRAQSLNTLLGKLLRVDVDSGAPFAIPPSNPFLATPGARPEIWAYGLRNPWRFSFDRETGDVFVGDVGEGAVEEIDFQPAASPGGENYGWRRMEGSRCFNPGVLCNTGMLVLPILEYDHGGSGGSVTGGYRYRGVRFPQLRGVYFYADFVRRWIEAATRIAGSWIPMGPRNVGFQISTFGEDEAGELYFADYDGGQMFHITIPHPTPTLTTISPENAATGSQGLSVTVTGENFVPAAEVRWDGSPRQTTFLDNSHLQVAIPASDLTTPGVFQITVFNPAPAGGLSQAAPFAVEGPPPMGPSINEGGVGSAAGVTAVSGVPAGSIAAVFGLNMALTTESAEATPLPNSLGGGMLQFTPNGSGLRFNGEIAVPQFFASPTQMNIQIPWELAGLDEALLTAIVGELTSAPEAVEIVLFNPGIFTTSATGMGQGSIVIVRTGGALAAPLGMFSGSRPVRRGEFIAIFATGLGDVTNTPATGFPATADPLSETTTEPEVTIGGVTATVTFSGLAPTFVGLYQVNVEIPESAPSGDAIEVVITIAGVQSNVVTIAIE
jgi:uncharacterized protein (TIGR03437 family)